MTTPPPPPGGGGNQPYDPSASNTGPGSMPGQGSAPDYGSAPGQPPQAPPPAPGGFPQGGEDKAKTMAIISLVTGGIGLLCCTWFVFSIAAIILGILGKKAPGSADSHKKAQIGLILGIVGVVLGVIVWPVLIATGSLDVYTN